MTGSEIRFKRRMLGLSTQDLADRVGVTKQTISNIELDKTASEPVMRIIEIELGKAFVEWKVF